MSLDKPISDRLNRFRTCFRFLSTSFARFANSSLISVNFEAKRSRFSPNDSCVLISDCQELTNVLQRNTRRNETLEDIQMSYKVRARRCDDRFKTHPAFPSFIE